MRHQAPRRALLISLMLMALYLGITVHTVLMAPASVSEFLFSEAGAYETFSSWLWFLLALLCSLSSNLQPRTRQIAAASAMLMGARELDLHKALFDMSFIKSRFYVSADIPLTDKLLGGLLLLLTAALLIYLACRFLQQLRRRGLSELAPSLVLAALLLGVTSKVLDRLSSQMKALFGIRLPADTSLMISSLEESIEMLLPVLLISALLTYRRSLR